MSTRETRTGKQTKEWILDTACQLFNAHGTAAISTKRLAQEMGISPGNLYYHFKNKEEIIRALLSDKMEDFTDDWNNPNIPALQRFLGVVHTILRSWQDCQFFKKELVALFRNDPELKQLYQANRQMVGERARLLLQELLDAGALHMPDDPAVFDSLITISWIIAEYWITFLDVSDEPVTPDTLQRGANLIIQVWKPYLTDAAQAELTRLMAEQS